MKKEYDFKKLKGVRRGAKSEKNPKVIKTFRIDLDVLTWLQEEAEKKGLPYQTLTNSILRQNMTHNEHDGDERIREIVREELKRRVG